jgi:putative ABC transport system substrate-binding protein
VRRREVITLLGGAAAAWPVVVRAQQRAIPVIGFLIVRARATSGHLVTAFRQGLRETGYIEGDNVTIEYRFAEGHPDRLPALAAGLVESNVAVMAVGPGADLAAKAATTTIPIVFMTGVDPVNTGLVTSLNRPGGNLTGTTMLAPDLEAKRIGLLHELVPGATTISVLISTRRLARAFVEQEVQTAGRNVGVAIRIVAVDSERDFDAAFADIARQRTGALMVAASSYFNDFRERLAALAIQHRLPTIFEIREFVEAGGLMSYAPRVTDAYHQVGVYVGRILKGEKPADLPVVLPSRFEFLINLKTAKALDLEIPPMLLARADEVIE